MSSSLATDIQGIKRYGDDLSLAHSLINRRTMHYAFTLLFVAALFGNATVHADTVRLTSLEWPPYASNQLPDQGASIAVTRAAFQAMGHTLEVDFFPWSRTIATARSDDDYAGYLPEYHLESGELLLSDSIGSSPVGFAERKDQPVHWNSLEELSGRLIGTVQDYINTPELDAQIAAGQLQASETITDRQNLLKLAAGHVDLAVIDRYVLEHLCTFDTAVRKVCEQIQWNPNPLGTQSLHVAFNNTPMGRQWLAIFNEGLARIDVDGVLRDYFAAYANLPVSAP